MSGRLDLRRGVVVSARPLLVEVEGERRPAWADVALLGEMREGDEVVVNCAALELGLGSGGFDLVHVNLTRGLGGGGEPGGEHVIKLNYTSLQHPVAPVEGRTGAAGIEGGSEPACESGRVIRPMHGKVAPTSDALLAVAVLPLHGHLAPAAWAAAQASPGTRVGYVQTAGGALPGALSRDVAVLRERGLLAGHITAAPAYGGEHEALSVAGALGAAAALAWDAALVGPGPGIIGSETAYGHGGMAALDNVHAALALAFPTVVSPRLSSADPRDRHRGLSHHTATVLALLLTPVEVAFPEDGDASSGRAADGAPAARGPLPEAASALASLRSAAGDRHRVSFAPCDLDAYAASGLPTTTMGRQLEDDPLFFASPLATGTLLARVARGRAPGT